MNSSDILSHTTHDLVETRTCNSSSQYCMPGNCPECLKPVPSLSDFKADVDLISFWQWQRIEKKIVKVNQTMPFGQVITQVERVTKMSVVSVRNFIIKMKHGFSVILARYGSIKNVLQKTFQLTLKICDLNFDLNDSFLLSYMFDLAVSCRYNTKQEQQLRDSIAKIYWNREVFDLICGSGIWMKHKTPRHQASSPKF